MNEEKQILSKLDSINQRIKDIENNYTDEKSLSLYHHYILKSKIQDKLSKLIGEK